jgi:hypothetical protein
MRKSSSSWVQWEQMIGQEVTGKKILPDHLLPLNKPAAASLIHPFNTHLKQIKKNEDQKQNQ